MPAFLIPPGDAKSVSLGGLGVVFKITREETGGCFSVVEHPIEPGRIVYPHMHTKEDEFSYVLEGEIGVRIGGRDFRAGTGPTSSNREGCPTYSGIRGPSLQG
jgi:quercetin dioxygenase-like cupin family protein